MNPHEQQERHTAISEVHARIETLAGAVDAEVAERVHEIRLLIARLLTAEHAERLDAEQQNKLVHLANYQRTMQNTRSIVTLNFYASQFLTMSFWERMRWNLLGRLPEHLSEFVSDPEATLLSEHSETSQTSHNGVHFPV
jgi:hypothetical protein